MIELFDISKEDIVSFLQDEGIGSVRERGGDNNFSINSPFTSDTKSRCNFVKHDEYGWLFNDLKARGNIDSDLYHGSIFKFIKLYKNFYNQNQAKNYFYEKYVYGKDIEFKPQKIKNKENIVEKKYHLPTSFEKLNINKEEHSPYLNYLLSRGFSKDKILNTNVWVDFDSKRIQFPIYESDELIFWTGRAILKYIPKELRWKKCSIKDTHPVWNLDKVTENSTIYIFEGILDAMSLETSYGEYGVAILLGILSDTIRTKILSKNPSKIVIVMQNAFKDKTAKEQQFKIAEKLSEYHENIYVYDWSNIEEKDNNEILKNKKIFDKNKIMKWNLETDILNRLRKI